MKTVLVKYKELVKSNHYMIDDNLISKSKIVQIEDLAALNEMFTNITEVKILINN